MKISFYRTLIINALWYPIFLCFCPIFINGQPSLNELPQSVSAPDKKSEVKRRRVGKRERFRMKNEQQRPPVTPAPPLVANAVLPLKKPVSSEPESLLKSVSVPQEELAHAFKQREDPKAHLIRDVSSLRPQEALQDSSNAISVNLDKTELLNLLGWIETIFKVKFLTGDAVTPPAAGRVAGNLISYKTHKPMSKKQVWDLFLNFLDLFGLTLVATHYTDDYPDSYTVMPIDTANQAPLPAFVGVDWRTLPNNDTKIRYVYFVENGPAANLSNIVQDFKSKSAVVQAFGALNAIIFSDKAANIRSLMAIISELDNVSMPEAMSVLKLKHANAIDVVSLYQNLVSTEEKGNIATRLFGAKKQPTAIYFPDDTQLFAEERSNALIILGNREGISKVENFILDYVDTELKQPYSPLYVHKLEYANADNIAAILTKVTAFAQGTAAAKYGGVIDGDKYFRPMTFIAEPSGNKLLIKAEKDDYLKVKEIIKKLDVKQPQVAIEVLIVSVTVNKIKALGTQIRNKSLDTVGISDNIAFQTSGIGGGPTPLSGIVTNAAGGLMGNLVSLATGFVPGTTLISIGSNIVGGVWALFQALETYAYTNVVSHPFLTTTNKYTAQVSVGETRRVATGTVTGAGPTLNTLGDVTANLSVAITPQINSSGIINLEIQISIDTFTDADATSPTKDTKVVKTNANLANNEILAIGGLLLDNISEVQNGVPLLQRVPLLGWFFKNKAKTKLKDNLVIFISPQIVQPRAQGGVGGYTDKKVAIAQNTMCDMRLCSELRDPIHRWFFGDYPCENTEALDDFINNASECNVTKAYNCRTGQEYEEDAVETDMARCCPPVICPNNYEDCRDHCVCPITPTCIPECPRPCQPMCDEYGQYIVATADDDKNKQNVQPKEKTVQLASNQDHKKSQPKRTPLKRKLSITDFLPETKEVVAC